MNPDTNNEVARLRELLNRAIEIAGNYEIAGLPRDGFMLHWKTNKYELAKLKARLAPAPEEPVIKESLTTEPDPEWRELGPDEVIQEGDEEPKDGGGWMPVLQCYVGKKAKGRVYPVRTRRPLPRREGEQPYCSRCKYNHAFPCEGSLAGVPLETPLDLDIEEIEAVANHPFAPRVDFYTRQLAMRSAHAIRYLRDEIQKLKEAQP